MFSSIIVVCEDWLDSSLPHEQYLSGYGILDTAEPSKLLVPYYVFFSNKTENSKG